MPNFSKVIQIGHMVRDPELRYLTNNTPVCDFTIATNYKWGEKEETSFIGCTAFGKTAELVAKHFTKGAAIGVEGRLSQQKWENEEGQKREKTKITVNSIIFLGSKKEGRDAAPEENSGVEPF